MVATVHQLHKSRPIAAVLRVGHRDHRWVEDRLAAGRLPFRRFVFDAAHIDKQMQLVNSPRNAGHEIILDTNFAELSAFGKFQSAASRLPWARPDRPWQQDDLGGNRTPFLASQIAEFAISHSVDVVLNPTRLIEATNESLAPEAEISRHVRAALDRLGGSNIALDFELVTTAAVLKDAAFRNSLAVSLKGVPAENVWIRTSGFDATSTGSATRRYIEALRDLHSVGLPIIGDMTGGVPALAAAAAGALGGFSHGLGKKEAFRASDYRRIPVAGGGGGVRRVYVADLSRWVTEQQFHELAQTKGAKPKILCRDGSCCPQGVDDMVENSKGHFLQQRAKQIAELSRVPEARREEHFLLHHIGPALRTARALSKLKYKDAKVEEMILTEKKRLTLFNDVLSDLLVDAPTPSRSESPPFRGGRNNVVVLGGRG